MPVQAKVEAARAVLARLLQDVAAAEARLSNSHAQQLMEANEQLVVAALSSQTAAETAASALAEAELAIGVDALTQLPNRVMLQDRFAQASAIAKRHGSRLALLFLDLDNFKRINDTQGHAAGDAILKRVSNRLTESVRHADTVSRHGGDEFLVLMTEVAQSSDAAVTAAKLAATVHELSAPGAGEWPLNASIGISLYPDDGLELQTLIDKADAAMYRAKGAGPGSFAFHGGPVSAQPSTPQRVAAARRRADSTAGATAQDLQLAQLREANEKLLLATLSEQELRAAAERAQKRQGDFLAAVAQELNNPQAPIRQATAMLGLAHGDLPMLPRIKALVEQQVDHMARLVRAVHGISRANAPSANDERHPVDLAKAVARAVESCRPAIDARLQKLVVHADAPGVRVLARPRDLVQILATLLDNASKFTPDHGRITLSTAVAGQTAVLTVSDNGMGIAEPDLPHIFEPFAQASRALGVRGVGVGIGLTVVRALVETLGGSVVASSRGSEHGSQFVVMLPIAEGLEESQPAGGHGVAAKPWVARDGRRPSDLGPRENLLLAALGSADWKRWQSRLEWVDLPLGRVLYEAGDAVSHVYFPTSALVALFHVMEDGASAEIAVAGREGLVGVSVYMGGGSTPSRAVVQSAGAGFRLGAQVIKEEFNRSNGVMNLLLRYTQALIAQMTQTAACNRHHAVEQQLCRLLLLSLDRLPGDELKMTQELLSHMLGVRREGVTEAAVKLQKHGVIRYSRGRIQVLDRPALEERACECYEVVKREYDRLLPSRLVE